VNGEVQILLMGRQSNGFMGIGHDLRMFIITILPNSSAQIGFSNQGSGDDVQEASGFQQFSLFAPTTLSISVNQQDFDSQGVGVEASAKTQMVPNGRVANTLQVIGQNFTQSAQAILANSTDPQATGNQADAASSKSQSLLDAGKAGKSQGNSQSVAS